MDDPDKTYERKIKTNMIKLPDYSGTLSQQQLTSLKQAAQKMKEFQPGETDAGQMINMTPVNQEDTGE